MENARAREFSATNYGRVAALWDTLERFSLQPLTRVRNVLVKQFQFHSRNPLVAGCGTGRFSLHFIDSQKPVRLTLNDLAPEMLARAVRRVRASGWSGTLIPIESDMTELRPEEPYDFVALQFVLTCFPQSSRALLISKMRRSAAPDAIWLICDYSRPRRPLMLPLFYLTFFATVAVFWCLGANAFECPGDTEKAILESGLTILCRREVAGGLYTAWLARFASSAPA